MRHSINYRILIDHVKIMCLGLAQGCRLVVHYSIGVLHCSMLVA